ncbi:MAG: hypothetical protein M1814_000004 [Vezdaea aestivalis]|nr:MAG: hypothetical protein M1814_000004 [Vezdaea aestivalis]
MLLFGLTISSLLLSISASPVPDGGIGIHCDPSDPEYNITSQVKIRGPTHFVTGTTVMGCAGGCSISDSHSFSVGITITVGGGLDLSKIVGVGVQASVATTTTNGQAITAAQGCPAGTQCGLTATATLYHIKGFKVTESRCFGIKEEPYDVTLPVLVPGADKAAPAEVFYSACYISGHAPAKPIAGFAYPICPPLP